MATFDANGDGYLELGGLGGSNLPVYCGAALCLGPFSGSAGWEDATTTISLGLETYVGDSANLIDGDGGDDFAFGMQPDKSAETTPGHVSVYTGAMLAAGGELDEELDRYMWIPGEHNGDETGRLLYPADFDGDGVIDLAVHHSSTREEDGTYHDDGSDVWLGIGGPD